MGWVTTLAGLLPSATGAAQAAPTGARLRAAALAGAFCALAPFAASAADDIGDVERGASLYKKQCSNCHQVGTGATNRIGPQLNGIFGRVAGVVGDFRYSKDMVRMGAGGLEWHAETLDPYLQNPRALISGTRMSYRGMKDGQDRADVIAYLRTFSDNPADIPEADPTAIGTDHGIDPEILALVGDAEYGAYLASECTSCHQAAGGDAGIPSIVFWPEEDFVIALQSYKRGIRPHPVMQMIAGRLSDEEIASLAAYFRDPE